MSLPIVSPELLPVESIDTTLTRVDPCGLTPDGLRERFQRELGWTPEPQEVRWTADEPRQAAVLVPLVIRDRSVTVLLTRPTDTKSRRSSKYRSHS